MENTIKGRIKKRIFKGATIEYHISTKYDELIAMELSRDKIYNEDDIVFLELKYKAII